MPSNKALSLVHVCLIHGGKRASAIWSWNCAVPCTTSGCISCSGNQGLNRDKLKCRPDPQHQRESPESQARQAWAQAALQRLHPYVTHACRADLCVGGQVHATATPL